MNYILLLLCFILLIPLNGFAGNCDYPDQRDSIGRRCGGRAASVRPGGRLGGNGLYTDSQGRQRIYGTNNDIFDKNYSSYAKIKTSPHIKSTIKQTIKLADKNTIKNITKNLNSDAVSVSLTTTKKLDKKSSLNQKKHITITEKADTNLSKLHTKTSDTNFADLSDKIHKEITESVKETKVFIKDFVNELQDIKIDLQAFIQEAIEI